jgi:hypothetical protein
VVRKLRLFLDKFLPFLEEVFPKTTLFLVKFVGVSIDSRKARMRKTFGSSFSQIGKPLWRRRIPLAAESSLEASTIFCLPERAA